MRNSCLHSDTIFNISHAYLYTNIMPKQIQVILSATSFAQKKKLLTFAHKKHQEQCNSLHQPSRDAT
ncbi:MAG: hypothetical protein IJE43_24070, partial [Alphaproteobacteria bacterium]|nr:hypothetical protein [Alphaproteobacteria bacterium]